MDLNVLKWPNLGDMWVWATLSISIWVSYKLHGVGCISGKIRDRLWNELRWVVYDLCMKNDRGG